MTAAGAVTPSGDPGPGGDPAQAASAERFPVQVISRAASILRALENRPEGLSLGQIAVQVSLPRSTVQRIAGALLAEHLLIAASPNGRLRLGPALLRLAGSVETDSLALARPVVRALSEALGETVDLATVRGSDLVFIDQIVGNQRLRTVSAVGEKFPLFCTANGKAYLATLNDADIVRIVGPSVSRRTPKTLADMPALLRDIEQVRQSGVAFDEEEHSEGISAAGVCLSDFAGSPLLLSVPVPSSRYVRRKAAIVDALIRAREDLAARFARGTG